MTDRRASRLLVPALFALALGVLLQHFLGALAWAGLLAVITWPAHVHLQRRGWPRAASAACLVGLLILGFVGPSILLLDTLGGELAGVQRLLARANETGIPVPVWIARLPLVAEHAVQWWNEHLALPGGLNRLVGSAAGDFAPHLTGAARLWGSTILANALYLFLALLTLFVLYLHGPAAIRHVDTAGMRALPRQYPMLRRVFPLSVRGTALGSVTFTNESASGWQTALFATPVTITAGQTYVVSYLAPNGHYSATGGAFGSAVDNSPLHAPASATSDNGLYIYSGTSVFPTNTWNATNYWVDVLFSAN